MAIQSMNGFMGVGNATALNNGGSATTATPPIPRSADASATSATSATSAAATHSSQNAATQSAQGPEPSLAEVKKAAEDVQQIVQARANNLHFAVEQDQDAGKTVVKLQDKQSGEVILQIPSKEMISIAKEIDKLLGMFVRQKA